MSFCHIKHPKTIFLKFIFNYKGWKLSDATKAFKVEISVNGDLSRCVYKKNQKIFMPSSYDVREEYPLC
jgi:hypothetical protein